MNTREGYTIEQFGYSEEYKSGFVLFAVPEPYFQGRLSANLETQDHFGVIVNGSTWIRANKAGS